MNNIYLKTEEKEIFMKDKLNRNNNFLKQLPLTTSSIVDDNSNWSHGYVEIFRRSHFRQHCLKHQIVQYSIPSIRNICSYINKILCIEILVWVDWLPLTFKTQLKILIIPVYPLRHATRNCSGQGGRGFLRTNPRRKTFHLQNTKKEPRMETFGGFPRDTFKYFFPRETHWWPQLTLFFVFLKKGRKCLFTL